MAAGTYFSGKNKEINLELSQLIISYLFKKKMLGLSLEDAELVVENLSWNQKRNAADVATFAALIHLR